MARRRQNLNQGLIEVTSKLPWWVAVMFALVAYLGLHSVAVSEVTATVQPGQLGPATIRLVSKSVAAFAQYVVPFLFLVGAGVAAFLRHQRGALHEHVALRPDRADLDDMSWQQFEALVGEAFRRRGYAVTETGGGGADGGVDLVLRKDAESFLVQCKQWKAYKVGVTTVRELYGVMAAKGATGGFVVTSGVFTNDARAFAEGRNIKLLDGVALHALIRGVNAPEPVPTDRSTANAPACPVCKGAMTKRTAAKGANAGKEFWGCMRFPACRGTRPA
jgi:restriction system protein